MSNSTAYGCCTGQNVDPSIPEHYRQAYAVSNDALVDVWLPVSLTPIFTGQYTVYDFGSETCVYILSADAPTTSPGTVITSWQATSENSELCAGSPTITGLKNTGQVVVGNEDQYWEIDDGSGFAPALKIGPDAAWLVNDADYDWIGGNLDRSPPGSTYTVKTTFTLGGDNPYISLPFQVAVDNRIVAIRVNGVAQPSVYFDIFNTFANGVIANTDMGIGTNVIEFDIEDEGSISGMMLKWGNYVIDGRPGPRDPLTSLE